MSNKTIKSLREEKKLEEQKYFNAQVLGDRVGMKRAEKAIKRIDREISDLS